jgi:hypothetical protein
LNRLFNTDEFSEFIPTEYENDNGVTRSVDIGLLISKNVEPENFIEKCAMDILSKKPTEIEAKRLVVYEDIFINIFNYPIKIEKSQLENQIIDLLMEQRRRGLSIDVEYMKSVVDYNNLNIYHKLNYQYLSNDFSKVRSLLLGQIETISKNYITFV